MRAVNLEKLLPADIPPGERVLWFGRPEPTSLWRRAYRADWVGALVRRDDGVELRQPHGQRRRLRRVSSPRCTRSGSGRPLWRSSAFLAWLSARTTLYVVTERRIVIKTGIALPMFINVPFKQIASANVRAFADGTGDVTGRPRDRPAHSLSGAVAERASAALHQARTGAALHRKRPRGRRHARAARLAEAAGQTRDHVDARASHKPASRAASRRRPPEQGEPR